MAKKKKIIDLMTTKLKTLLSKISKEHRIRFGNNHNHVILIIQKSGLLLNWFGSSIISRHSLTIVRYVIHSYLPFAASKQGSEFLTVWSCHRLPDKRFRSFKSYKVSEVSTVCIMIIIWTTQKFRDCSTNICMLMASFLFM